MTLAAGDLTTQGNVAAWVANPPPLPSQFFAQRISAMTALIYAKLNRARTYSQTFVRTFDGVGNMQLVLPDYPVTSITTVQVEQHIVLPSILPPPNVVPAFGQGFYYGYRFIPWAGNLPGENAVLEFRGGHFPVGPQNTKVTYTAGYLISAEAWAVPASPGPYTVTTLQPQGTWARDNGVTYAATGVALTAVKALTGAGQYLVGPDDTPGLYTFDAADAGAYVLISYSFIPAPLEEACIQMVAERYSYRSRIGEVSKSLGGQETIRFLRGGTARPYGTTSLPPEVMDLISDYVSVVPPIIGAPV